METLVVIGVEPRLATRIASQLEAEVIATDDVPVIYALDGRAHVEHGGRSIEPAGVIFYGAFDTPESAIARRALALSETPTFPDVRHTLPLDDKTLALIAALESGVAPLPRGYVPPGGLPRFTGERVLKWGHRHGADDKVRADAGFVTPAPAVVEPFLEGTSERILIVGDRRWHLEYRSDDWRKNVHGTVHVREQPERELLTLGERVASHLGLLIAGVDFVVQGGIAYLLEVNAYPRLADAPASEASFLALADEWWRRVIR